MAEICPCWLLKLDEPTGYGRLLLDDENGVTGIVEEADAFSGTKKN